MNSQFLCVDIPLGVNANRGAHCVLADQRPMMPPTKKKKAAAPKAMESEAQQPSRENNKSTPEGTMVRF